ncbi:Hypothetical protein, putative [Bodo saltans]|uniref:Uncharacterized protein n=1 Tax=Bodo saltans TaxID=75058 RepID=A0A0S4KLK6_BODSA|nr:Hypothetical protein, putative [Bodo saltans]|eukprot:CUI14463.1 Hypothetical protein, putative [Bodo saltans]
MPITARLHNHEVDSTRKQRDDDAAMFPGGWRAVPKFVIDHRFVTVSIETRLLKRSPASVHGGLFITFSYHLNNSQGVSSLRPPAAVSLRGGLRPQRFILTTCADDDHPQHVTICQRSLAIASVLYHGCATALFIDTMRCGVLTWEAHRDGCFGTCSIARSLSCGTRQGNEGLTMPVCETEENGGVVQAVALLNANLVMPMVAYSDVEGTSPPPLLILYCTDGQQGALASEAGDGGWVRHGTNSTIVENLSAFSFGAAHLMQSSARRIELVEANITRYLLPGGSTSGLLVPLHCLSRTVASLSSGPTGITNIVVLVNVEQRPTASWDDARLNTTVVAAIQGSLSRLAADNMDVFGRCSSRSVFTNQATRASSTLSVEDAGRIQCIANAVTSMVMTSRLSHHRGGTTSHSISSFEETLHNVVAIPQEARPRPGDAPLTAATLRFFIEESLRRQYSVGCGPQ